MEVRILSLKKDFAQIERIKKRSSSDQSLIEANVKQIIKKVRDNGDKALIEFTEKFDKVKLDVSGLVVSKKEIEEAYKGLEQQKMAAIKNAIRNIRRFAELQMPRPFAEETTRGIRCGVLLRPIGRIGCYIPGGRYPLPSTTYMTIVPAKAAGVKEVIVASPPGKDGKINPAILIAADLSGADMIVKAGGSQAIAAMAFGTKSVPKVDKIVGPGNIYVTAAKKLLYGDVGIDMPAGPSELLIIASEKSDPGFIAADMLAQAEHDIVACSLLLTASTELAEQVKEQLLIQAEKLPTKEIIRKSFENYSSIVLVDGLDEAVSFSNAFAPEHLEIIGYPEQVIDRISNAGSIFFGEYACEAAGDYCSGTNHVLPTGSFSRVRAGLSVYDFLKMPTIQYLTKEGLRNIKDDIRTIAELEGLYGHANSANIRFK